MAYPGSRYIESRAVVLRQGAVDALHPYVRQAGCQNVVWHLATLDVKRVGSACRIGHELVEEVGVPAEREMASQ